MNIIITTRCNAKCDYCFARPESLRLDYHEMPVSLFKKILKFMKDDPEIKILGGEPTLHKKFKEMIFLALKESKMITLFTNGFVDKLITDFLKGKGIHFIVNLTADTFIIDKAGLRSYFLKSLGENCSFGINYSDNFKLDILYTHLELLKKYNAKKTIRLGIVSPMPDFDNEYFDFFINKEKVNNDLKKISKILFSNGIRIEYDCSSFPICCLKDSTIGAMKKNTGADIRTNCSWLNMPLDILPDGHAIRCFGMSGIRADIDDFSSPQEMRNYLRLMDDFLMKSIKSNKCRNCQYSSALCSSGCLANRYGLLKKFPKNKYHFSEDFSFFMDKDSLSMINEKDLIKSYTINDSGNFIIKMMMKGFEPKMIAEEIRKCYFMGKDSALEDVNGFIERLRKQGIIT